MTRNVRATCAVAVSAALVIANELSRMSGTAMPIPFLLLYASVVFGGAFGGKRGGAASAAIACAYMVYAGSYQFGPRTLTGGPLSVGLGVLLYAATGLMLGHLRDQKDRFVEERRRHEIELESQIHARTESLDRTIAMLRLFEQFSDTSRDLLAMIDSDNRFLVVNRAFCTYFGVEATRTIGRKVPDIVGAELFERAFRDPVARGMKGEVVRFDAAADHAAPGSRWFECNVRPVRAGHGASIIGVVLGARDITGRRAAERDLIESRDHIRLIADNLPVLITHVDREMRYRFVNENGAKWLGRPAGEIVGTTIWDMHGSNLEALRPALDAAMRGEGGFLETEMTFPDGVTRSMQTRYVPEFGADGQVQGFFVIAEDVTELKKVKEHLLQARKLEAVGQMTGGLAHDFNNLLAVIQGNAELLASGRTTDIPAATEPILDAARRGSELIRRLLAFSRRQPLRSEPVDCGELVSGMRNLLERTLGESVELEIVVSPGLWAADIDRGQLESALLNLAINARDAMPAGGSLVIECGNARLDGASGGFPNVAPGEYVVLSVRDTGTGMTPDVADHAFEPFFTTKEVGEGSGLGLSMVYGFARQSGGHAAIAGAPGGGTSVTLYLPRSARLPASAPEVEEASVPRGNGEKILVVEDDAGVRALVVRMLRNIGYSTVEAGRGTEAVALLGSEDDIELVLSDVVLPGGMSGLDIARQIRVRYPALGIVLMSGHRTGRAGEPEPVPDGIVLLDKPFRLAALASAVRDGIARRCEPARQAR